MFRAALSVKSDDLISFADAVCAVQPAIIVRRKRPELFVDRALRPVGCRRVHLHGALRREYAVRLLTGGVVIAADRVGYGSGRRLPELRKQQIQPFVQLRHAVGAILE